MALRIQAAIQASAMRPRVQLRSALLAAPLPSRTSRSARARSRALVVTSAIALAPSGSNGLGDSSSAALGAARGEDSWQVKILFDGDCPICMKEVEFLRQRNRAFRSLCFVDISDPLYSAEENAGVEFEEAMGHIHAITRDGRIFTGVEAFQTFYEAVGLGWVFEVTKLPVISAVADGVYELWAKYRLPLSGRASLDAVLEERRRAKEGVQHCDEECAVEW